MLRMVTSALTALSVVSLCASVASCGGTGRPATSVSALVKSEQVTVVSPELGPLDPDDDMVLKFGRPASLVESREIVAVLKRYYEVAMARDGTRACSMLYSVAAREVVVEDGRLPGSLGTTCPVIMTKLFTQGEQRLAFDLRSFKVLRVRVEGHEARVVLRFAASGVSREIFLSQVSDTWKLRQSLDEPMP